MLLTLLTISVTICWVPLETFYTMMIFDQTMEFGTFFKVSTALFYLESVLDPLYFVLAITELRVEVLRLLKVVGRNARISQ